MGNKNQIEFDRSSKTYHIFHNEIVTIAHEK